jgi:hypothetical protein
MSACEALLLTNRAFREYSFIKHKLLHLDPLEDKHWIQGEREISGFHLQSPRLVRAVGSRRHTKDLLRQSDVVVTYVSRYTRWSTTAAVIIMAVCCDVSMFVSLARPLRCRLVAFRPLIKSSRLLDYEGKAIPVTGRGSP